MGFALFGAFRGGPGYVHTVEHSIYLVPEAQDKGLGRALMDTLVSAAMTLGHHAMIGAISGGNANAVAFHENVGSSRLATCLKLVVKMASGMI